MSGLGPARERLDELQRQIDRSHARLDQEERTADYPVVHLANMDAVADEVEFYEAPPNERALRRRLRALENRDTRKQIHLIVSDLALLSTWVVLWQKW